MPPRSPREPARRAQPFRAPGRVTQDAANIVGRRISPKTSRTCWSKASAGGRFPGFPDSGSIGVSVVGPGNARTGTALDPRVFEPWPSSGPGPSGTLWPRSRNASAGRGPWVAWPMRIRREQGLSAASPQLWRRRDRWHNVSMTNPARPSNPPLRSRGSSGRYAPGRHNGRRRSSSCPRPTANRSLSGADPRGPGDPRFAAPEVEDSDQAQASRPTLPTATRSGPLLLRYGGPATLFLPADIESRPRGAAAARSSSRASRQSYAQGISAARQRASWQARPAI